MSQEKTEIELPYFLFGDEFPLHVYAFEIEPTNENKRIRVFGTQLVDTVVDNTTLTNFNWNIGVFFKMGTRLIRKYPQREDELNKILINFWTKMQIKYKQLQENK